MKRRSLFTALLLFAATPLAAEMKTDVEFSSPGGFRLTLDAWVPDGAGPYPAVIVVHGGGWQRGDKQTFVKPWFAPLTEGGFAWFTINYRLAPAHRYPAAVDDVVAAVRWVREHARDYKVDVRRIGLVGESAGGHLVALVGARQGNELGLRAVVPFYAPADLEALVETSTNAERARSALAAFFGFTELNAEARRKLREASPVAYLSRKMPPFLLIHGTADRLVPFSQSEDFCKRIRAAGGSCELHAVEGADHGIGTWEKNPALHGYKKKLVEWLRQTLT